MVLPTMSENPGRDPYAPQPAREPGWPDHFFVGRTMRTQAPPAASAFGPKKQNPFPTGPYTADDESATYILRDIWIQQLKRNIPAQRSGTKQQAATWLRRALEELEEIDREVVEDGLPAIKTETKDEAARILRRLQRQAIQPTTYATGDGEIMIHFQSPGVPAAVLIELSNDGQGACFACVDGKNRRARYDDSADLPDAFVMAQLETLARKAGQ